MHLQLFFAPGCVDCLAVRLLIKRIKAGYPGLEVEEIHEIPQLDAAARVAPRWSAA